MQALDVLRANAAGLVVLAACASAQAQDAAARAWPNKPVRIVIGLAAGGGIDVITRVVARKMSESLGQPVIVDNKPGASGIIAAEAVARSAPDGYTLMMAPSGPMVINAVLFTKLPYSPTKDFVPVSMVASFPLFAVVDAATPVKTVREMADLAKRTPAKANYSASSSAFQLATELFNIQAGTALQFISYKSTAESINAVLAGDVLTSFADTGPASALVRGGKLRALAVTAHERLPAFPDVPTMAEAGYPGLEVQFWTGLFAPAGTPPAIVRSLEDHVAKALKNPEVLQRFSALTISPGGANGVQLAALVADEIARWGAVAKKANIPMNN